MKTVLSCLLSSVFTVTLTLWLTNADSGSSVRAQSVPRLVPPTSRSVDTKYFDATGLTAEEAVAVAVYERVNRSVVNITTRGTRSDNFFQLDVPTEGAGSGSVIDKSGHILTNFHVIQEARAVTVTLFDGNTYDAEYVGGDPVNDIAVIRVEAPRDVLFPVSFGNSAELKVGMHAFAIGNPFGLERTLSRGLISSLNRSLRLHRNRTIKSIIQLDADINPGNSGGPLLDAHGRVIGMNTAIASSTGQSSGVGFAIPSNLISRVVPQLIRHGRVIRPEIGIARVYETERGLLIAKLTPGGAAEKAGLKGPLVTRQRRGPFVIERVDRSKADLITDVDDQKVESADDFLSYIESKRPGDLIQVTVTRQGEKLRIPVRLGGDDGESPKDGARSRSPKRIEL